MTHPEKEDPKAFISYSWTSSDHEAWVLQLATDLEESGIHVIIDKWDLREGADKYAFMEKMVTDKSIRKVIVICDRIYAEKADGRMGGVGTETQIISQKLYSQVDATDQEQKFVAIIAEKDGEDQPYVPTFLKSRIYIDMADATLRNQNFEQLLRWVYDQPLHKRPERGKPPSYVFEEGSISLGTTSRFRQAIEAIRQNKSSALGICREYFDIFAENLEKFRIEPDSGKEFDDQVIENLESFLPYRDEVVDLFMAIARYRSDLEAQDLIHSFFEAILPYGYWPAGLSSWNELKADNFKFILNELFIYAIATFLKHERFEAVNDLIEKEYYFRSDSPEAPEDKMAPFTYFNCFPRSFANRNKRLNLRRLSLVADLFKGRAKRHDLLFVNVMQADFLLYLRTELIPATEGFFRRVWWPETLVYASHRHPVFEVFARAQSTKYFNQMKVTLGITEKDNLLKLKDDYQSGQRKIPQWDFDRFDPIFLMNLDKIATKP